LWAKKKITGRKVEIDSTVWGGKSKLFITYQGLRGVDFKITTFLPILCFEKTKDQEYTNVGSPRLCGGQS
jgi:hypothetical protein